MLVQAQLGVKLTLLICVYVPGWTPTEMTCSVAEIFLCNDILCDCGTIGGIIKQTTYLTDQGRLGDALNCTASATSHPDGVQA